MTDRKHIIQLENIRVRYPLAGGGEKTVLNDVDLRVHEVPTVEADVSPSTRRNTSW